MLKIKYAGCLGLSPAILSQLTVEICTAAKNCEKFNKTLFWGFKVVHSFKVIDVDKSKKPITKSVPICNRFHIIKANSGKITSY